MQKSKNQQSIVRTDYTIKYIQLEDALEKEHFYKVIGTDANIFVRSWLDYSLSKGNLIIPWHDGEISDLVRLLSNLTKQSIDDKMALESYLSKKPDITFLVNFSQVDLDSLNYLINTIKKLQITTSAINSSVNTRDNDISIGANTENVDTVKLEKLTAHSSIKIVLWHKSKETLETKNLSLLTDFKSSLIVGAKAHIRPQKKTGAKRFLALGSLAFTCIAMTSYWFLSGNDGLDIGLNSAEEVAKAFPNESPEYRQNTIIVDEENSSSIARNLVADSSSEVIPSALQEENTLINIDIPDQSDNEVKSVTNVIVDNVEIKKSIENKEPEYVTAIIKGKQKTEKINISSAPGAGIINVYSSINTTSNIDGKDALSIDKLIIKTPKSNEQAAVNNFVDTWIDSWQKQDFNLYSNHYSDSFTGKKSLSHNQWLDWRRKRIEKPKWIKLSRSNIQYSVGKNSYELTFTLNYAAPNYKDKTYKKLVVNNTNGKYEIIKEENLKVTKLK